jgi:N-acetylglucosaminyldiphosphoundecaprenol N-acetyl-beta-D-mannosaminyltransferase
MDDRARQSNSLGSPERRRGGAMNAGGPNMSFTEVMADGGAAPSRDADAPFAQSSIQLLSLDFDTRSPAEVLRLIAARPADAPFAYVVTPNADHLVRLSRDPATYRPLYEGAWLRLLDSRVVRRLARLLGLAAPPVVTGSDLTAALVRDAAAAGEWVTILGLTRVQAQELAVRTRLCFMHHDPRIGFENYPDSFEEALRFIEDNPARLVFLAVGSPRQEMVARALAARGIAVGTGLCVGASLEFLAGTEWRAPLLVQKAGLEWAWRLTQNPQRLWRRYLVDDPAILRLLWREARGRR